MASIYRFRRKSKKEDPKNGAGNPSVPDREDFFPLLFNEELPVAAENAPTVTPVEAKADGADEKEEKTELPDFSDTREVSPSPDTAATAEISEDDTRTFQPICESEREISDTETKEIPVPEELLQALQEKPVDNRKFDEIFKGSKGSVSSATTPAEYDETTALLKEVFGTDPKKKKKKKKGGEAEDPEEIHSVFNKAKTLDEALSEIPAEAKSDAGDDYVAVHDSDEEQTKEYQASLSMEEFEEQMKNLHPEEATNAVPELADEVRVPDQDNPYADTYDELEEVDRSDMGLPEEYTSPEEYDEFAEHLRGRNFKSMCTVLWSMLTFLLLLYLESATFSDLYHPEILKPGGIYNSVIYLLVDIQLVLISALLTLSTFVNGLKGLFTGKPNRNSVSAFMTLFALIHPAVLLTTGVQEYPLFGSLAALFLFFGAVAGFLESKRIYRTFRIFGKRGTKLVATEVVGESAEAEAFREQLTGDATFHSVHKAAFVDDFFARVGEEGKWNRSVTVSLILSFLFAAAFAGFSYWKGEDVATSANRFMIMLSMTLPLSGLFTLVLPFSHLSKKAEKAECAVLSVAAADEYAASDVVSFTDKEIFPPKNVKVTTIRTYGQTRIDKALLYAAMIFQKMGGPLSHIFKKTISGVYADIPENFDFQEITADGMCAKIDGKDIFVGNKNYLLSYDFGYTKDSMDEEFEDKSGKIMYMVIGSELAAKFYIRYSMSKRFQKTILSLYKHGICPAVKTCDPNIDGDLFRTLLQNDKIPAGIIKTCDAMKDAPAEERSTGGMVCTSSIANLLHGFAICDSLRHLFRSNIAMKIISLLVGALVVVFLYFIGDLTKISGLFAILYQLLWLIPVLIPSLTE